MINSTVLAGAIFGMNMTIAYPPGFDPDPKYMDEARRQAKESGATIETTNNLDEACENADVILSTYWDKISPTEEGIDRDEYEKLRESLSGWRIDKKHFDIAAKSAIFMNCMLLQRGMSATAEVIDGPMSVLYDEAENRLHTEKTILALTMG